MTDLDELERVVAGATAGEWSAVDDASDTPHALTSTARPGESLLGRDRDGMAIVWMAEDARAIVALRNAFPALLAELRALRAVRDAAVDTCRTFEAHDPMMHDHADRDCMAKLHNALALAAQEVPRG